MCVLFERYFQLKMSWRAGVRKCNLASPFHTGKKSEHPHASKTLLKVLICSWYCYEFSRVHKSKEQHKKMLNRKILAPTSSLGNPAMGQPSLHQYHPFPPFPHPKMAQHWSNLASAGPPYLVIPAASLGQHCWLLRPSVPYVGTNDMFATTWANVDNWPNRIGPIGGGQCMTLLNILLSLIP